MHEAWTHELDSWHEFFLLAGTAGVTLTGLLFVVVTLGPRVVANESATGVRAFISPIAVFFAATMVVSMVALVPALPAVAFGALLCVGGAGSVGYLAYTRVHQRWRQNKLPVLDWVWYAGMPLAAYALLFVAGVGVLLQAALAIHGAALAVVLLLVIGIRNAWDIVIWISQQENK